MVGWYPELMLTRTAILRAKGYAVTETHDPADALRILSVTDPALVIVCHSIPRKLRRAIVSEMKHAKPLVPVLVFGPGIREADISVPGLAGPEVFLHHVAFLVGRPEKKR